MNQALKPSTLAFQAQERNLFFHLLTACNLSCVHCYINKEQHGTATLAGQTIADWLKLFCRPDKQTNVIFLGGEPTLHPELPFAVQTAKELGYHSITIDTNGFLHHDFLNRISPRDAVISFSLDGPDPASNDPIRGPGVFTTCTGNIGKAVRAGFEVSVICTVSSLNIDRLAAMPALLEELGVKNFFIQIIGLRGKSGNAAAGSRAAMQLSPAQWLATVPAVARQAAARGLRVIFPKVFLDPAEPFQCAGNVAENFFIFPNGRVYLCPLCEDYPLHSFSIENNRLIKQAGLIEQNFFALDIAEGCVMNKLLQPGSIEYDEGGTPLHRISCCLLKQHLALDSGAGQRSLRRRPQS